MEILRCIRKITSWRFYFVHDYSFSDRAEHLVILKEFILEADWHRNVKILYEYPYTLVMRTEHIQKDNSIAIWNSISQIKDDQYYRTLVVSSGNQ